MATERDRKIVRFVEDFGVVTTSQVYKLFFDDLAFRNCQLRLSLLTERGKLKRERASINKDYAYFMNTIPSQSEHHYVRAEFYIEASKKLCLVDFIPEYKCGGLRSDAYFEFEYDGLCFGAFLEVQLSSGFDQNKYEKFYASGTWHGLWDGFPPVVVVTNRRIILRPSEIKYIMMDVENFDFDGMLKEL